MLDMGFEPQIREILKQIPNDRQMMMFSATWPKKIAALAQSYMKDPVLVQIGSTEQTINKDVTQEVRITRGNNDKKRQVVDILKKGKKSDRTLIFVNTKRMCEALATELDQLKFKCTTIHGDLEQEQREARLNSFKIGHIHILIATDVAARGLDVKDIRVVVNYDAANSAEGHIHRTGRTGRAGQKGKAITLIDERDSDRADELLQVFKKYGLPINTDLLLIARKDDDIIKRRNDSFGASSKHSCAAEHQAQNKGYEPRLRRIEATSAFAATVINPSPSDGFQPDETVKKAATHHRPMNGPQGQFIYDDSTTARETGNHVETDDSKGGAQFKSRVLLDSGAGRCTRKKRLLDKNTRKVKVASVERMFPAEQTYDGEVLAGKETIAAGDFAVYSCDMQWFWFRDWCVLAELDSKTIDIIKAIVERKCKTKMIRLDDATGTPFMDGEAYDYLRAKGGLAPIPQFKTTVEEEEAQSYEDMMRTRAIGEKRRHEERKRKTYGTPKET